MNISRLILFIGMCTIVGQVSPAQSGSAEFKEDADALEREYSIRVHPVEAKRHFERQAAQPVNPGQGWLSKPIAGAKAVVNWSKNQTGRALTWTQGKIKAGADRTWQAMTLENIGNFTWTHKAKIAKYGVPLYLAYTTGFLSGLLSKGNPKPQTSIWSSPSPEPAGGGLTIAGKLTGDVLGALWRAWRAADPKGYYFTTSVLGFGSYFYVQNYYNNVLKKAIVDFYTTNVRPITTAGSIVCCLWAAKKITDKLPFISN